jgi:hypothetical protein
MSPDPWHAQRSRDGTIRLGVALAWTFGVGGLMYGGAHLLEMPVDTLPTIAIMGGLGAGAFILFFAGK